MGDVISFPILGEEKSVYACRCRVVARGGVVFEEVEEGEGGEEVGEAPVGGVGRGGEVEGEQDGGAEGEAEEEGVERYRGGGSVGVGFRGGGGGDMSVRGNMPVDVAVGWGIWCVGVVGLRFPGVAGFGGLEREGGGGRCHFGCWNIRGTTLGGCGHRESGLALIIRNVLYKVGNDA